MLAIGSSTKSPKITPNLLPCAIKHNGPVPMPERYWKPEVDASDSKHPTSYFRGRKLRGRVVKVPEGSQGVVLEKTNEDVVPAKLLNSTVPIIEDKDDEKMEERDEKPVEVKIMKDNGRFEEVVVWGHEVVPDGDDPYVKGVEEWMKIAEAMHFDRDSE